MNVVPEQLDPIVRQLSRSDVEAILAGSWRGDILRQATTLYTGGRIFNLMVSRRGLHGLVSDGQKQRPPLQVDIVVQSGNLITYCPCRAGPLCKHAGAVLLAWVDNPDQFVVMDQSQSAAAQGEGEDIVVQDEPDDGAPGNPVALLAAEVGETPLAEMARLLGARTMADLRAIAKARGVRLPTGSAGNREGYIATLVSVLSDLEAAQAEIASLTPGQRRALAVIAMLTDVAAPSRSVVMAVLQALAPSNVPPPDGDADVAVLLQRGLVLSERTDTSGRLRFPRVLRALPLTNSELLLPLTAVPSVQVWERRTVYNAADRLYMLWAFAHMGGEPAGSVGASSDSSQEVTGTTLRGEGLILRRRDPRPAFESSQPYLQGWLNDHEEVKNLVRRIGIGGTQHLTVLPSPPALAGPALRFLQHHKCGSAEEIEFFYALARDLGILAVSKGRAVPRDEVMAAFLQQDSAAQLRALFAAWLRTTRWSEVMVWLRTASGISLRRSLQASNLSSQRDLLHYLADSRSYVARILDVLQGEHWYAWEHFDTLVFALGRDFLQSDRYPVELYNTPRWWLSSTGNKMLHIRNADDWWAAWSHILALIIRGPLYWMGLVDVATDPSHNDTLLAFRLTAQWSVARHMAEGSGDVPPILLPIKQASEPPLVEIDERTFLLRHRSTSTTGAIDDGALRAARVLLSRLAVLTAVTTAGVVYRLEPQRVANAVAREQSIDEALAVLNAAVGGQVRAETADMLGQWWTRASHTRLHRDLTVLDIADEHLLDELLLSPVLRHKLVYRFSPRLVAIDPSAMDTIVTELQRRGYTPRVEG